MSAPTKLIFPKQIGSYIFKGTIGEGAYSIVKLVNDKNTKVN